MSSAAGTVLRYVRGSVALGNTFGTQIATPAFKPLRFTSDGLKGGFKVEKSKEVVNSFRTKQYRRVGIEAGGTLGLEFVYGNMDDFLESLLYSTWIRSAQRYNAAADQEITDVTAGTGVITVLAAAAGNPNRAGTFAVGHLVRATGFTNAGNNFLKRATAASGTSVTVSTAGLVNEAAPPLGARLKTVGIEAPSAGDIALTTSGIAGTEVCIITGTGISFVDLGVVAGMWFKASGFAGTTANNGFFRALSVTATEIRCDRAPTGIATDAAATEQVRLWLSDILRDGTDAIVWYDLERSLPQLAVPEFHYFLSMLPNSWTLQLTPQAITQCQLGFVGNRRTTGTARVAGATDLTADPAGALPRTGEMYDTSNNVAKILLGNTPLIDVVTDCSWQIANNAAGLPVVGNLGAGRINRPAFGPILGLNRYYDSRDVLASIEADTVVSLASILTDPVGTRAFVLDYPSAKTLSADLNDIVADQELSSPVQFGAIENTTFGCQVQLQRIEEYE